MQEIKKQEQVTQLILTIKQAIGINYLYSANELTIIHWTPPPWIPHLGTPLYPYPTVTDGSTLLTIPIQTNKAKNVDFEMTVNATRISAKADIATGKITFSQPKLSIYPNPTTDFLQIS